MSLHRPTAGHAPVLDDAPVAVLLAVLPANLVAQKHDRRLPKPLAVSQDTWSAPQAVSAVSRVLTLGFSVTYRNLAGAKFPKPWSSCVSRVSIRSKRPRQAPSQCATGWGLLRFARNDSEIGSLERLIAPRFPLGQAGGSPDFAAAMEMTTDPSAAARCAGSSHRHRVCR